eukprot:TRINITY_DN5172_c2_g2_i1.p1 TRINITY_DN5172_c2_g2~~TRINITY_DN5172_c2_g2_i1.p1  ORF type:complete len:124 (+),score=12.42 TRINITY_DN5172_c2_g2_i1:65-436(+)
MGKLSQDQAIVMVAICITTILLAIVLFTIFLDKVARRRQAALRGEDAKEKGPRPVTVADVTYEQSVNIQTRQHESPYIDTKPATAVTFQHSPTSSWSPAKPNPLHTTRPDGPVFTHQIEKPMY